MSIYHKKGTIIKALDAIKEFVQFASNEELNHFISGTDQFKVKFSFDPKIEGSMENYFLHVTCDVIEKKRIPKIGDIVIYNHPGSKDGSFEPSKSPAIIEEIYSHLNDTAKLWVFGSQGIFWNVCERGDGPCQWNWKEEVK